MKRIVNCSFTPGQSMYSCAAPDSSGRQIPRAENPGRRGVPLNPGVVGMLLILVFTQLSAAPQPPIQSTPRFTSLDIFIDPHSHPLAAYQFELKTTAGDAKIVGVEGGDHPAFKAPPYYDPAALMNGRIIIAAFSTAADLPAARTRVARLHMRIAGVDQPNYSVQLMTAGSIDGKPLDATVSIAQGATP